MEGEPIQLWQQVGVVREQRWQRAAANPHDERSVCIGHLADGRWFVEAGAQAATYRSERAARRSAEALMAGADWYEVPARYDAAGKPATPGPWVRVGSQYRRPRQ